MPHHHFHHYNSTGPRVDIVTITVKNNWTDVCHHANFYLFEFCSFLRQDPHEDECEATPLKVGALLCFRGVCICLPSLRRSSQEIMPISDTTELTARVRHRILISNDTVWPDWIASVNVAKDDDRDAYWVLACTALVLLTMLYVFYCALRVLCRYVGYKKVDPMDEEELASLTK